MRYIRFYSFLCCFICSFSVYAQKVTLKNKVDSVKYELKCLESDHLLIAANLEKNKKNYTQALELYYNAIKLNSNNSVAYFEIAQIYSQQMKFNEALKLSLKAQKISPDNTDILRFIAGIYDYIGKYDKQMLLMQEISKKNPEKLNVRYEIVEIYANRGERANALYALDDIEKEFGRNEYTLNMRYKIYSELQDYEKAEKYLKELILYTNNEREFVKELVSFYYYRNNQENVLRLCDSLLKLDNSFSEFKIYKAKIYSVQAKVDLLQKELLSIYADLNIPQDRKNELLKVLVIDNENDTIAQKKFDIISQILQVYPEEPYLHKILADKYLKDNNKEAALSHLYIAIKDANPIINNFNQIIDIELLNKNWINVIEVCKQAKEFFPNNPDLYISLGEAYIGAFYYDSAINVLNEGLEIAYLKKQKKSMYFNLGKACLYIHQFEESEKHFLKSISIDSADNNTLIYYALCLAFQKDKIYKAKQILNQSKSILATNDLQYFVESLILYQEGKNLDAILYLDTNKEFIAINNYYEFYGDILFLNKNEAEAIKAWDKSNEFGGTCNIQRKKLFLQKK